MNSQHVLLATKLVPPRVKAQCLRRSRLQERFALVADYAVTLVQADAGYGKSTALVTHLCSQYEHVAWYSVEAGERDAFLFLHYLIQALKVVNRQIGERSLRLLEEAGRTASVIQPCLTLLINDVVELAPEATVLVLDDIHTVAETPEIQGLMDLLIRHLPSHMHIVFGSRKMLDWPSVRRLASTFDLLQIGKEELAFAEEEIARLFQQEYHIELETEEVQSLLEQTEGWIIALQMIWKGLEQGIALPELWRSQPETGRRLFHYLAEEVFDRQPELVREFLERTCLLERLEPELCDRLTERNDSADILVQLERDGLFVTGAGHRQYRYHRLFQQFLVSRTEAVCSPEYWATLHAEAARHYQQAGDLQLAMQHFHRAGDLDAVVDLLLEAGEELLQSGRLELMKGWIDLLPSSVLEVHPQLLFWRGEIDRASSRFHEAAHWYTLAAGAYIQKGDVLGRSHVYRGQAQVYLDTIEPRKATDWLQKAVGVLGDEHPEEKAGLLRLMAENHTNSGRLQEAQRLVEAADELVPGRMRDELDIRIHLRTGRLQSAKEMTEETILKQERLNGGAGPGRVARSHRELHLLLSLIDAFLGHAASSRYHAEQGIHLGRALRSPFVEMVGYIRLGHALALDDRLIESQENYKRAMHICEELEVERGKVEALMGLCVTSGLLGELEQAVNYARSGLELALHVHDHWCANLIRLACGSIWTSWGHYEEALPWLTAAEAGFADCGDPFCVANVRLWLCILYQRTERWTEFAEHASVLFEAVEQGGYDHLFERRSLFGPCDLQMALPVLLEARDRLGLQTAERLLRRMGAKNLERHPGYTLQVRTLGKFVVHRGLEEVGRKEWKREKSRQLFQLLVARRRQLLQRDEIYDLLWPDDDEKTANRDFKVAMNALTNALEPRREARTNSFFIERMDTAYRLQSGMAVWIDAEEFEQLAEEGLALAEKSAGSRDAKEGEAALSRLERAIRLYQGDFFAEYPYLDWCAGERERIRTLYLRAMERLAELYRDRSSYQEAIALCERILACDGAWEVAYRLLMQCYHLLGNRSLVIATYKKCVTELEDLLGLSPMEETTRLYQRLVRGA
jgi:LuxR family transcriptional regulator, maltose regulon positive regulatory protein